MTSGNVVRARFFTTTHRIVGEVETGLKPLSDLLNDRSQSFLLVFNAQVSHIKKPGEIVVRASMAYLSKENLCFAIVPSRETRGPDRSRFTVHEYEAVATLPRVEVQGKFVGPHRLDVKSFSPAALDPFIVLTEATARLAGLPEVTFGGEAFLINRTRLECLCLME
jgi:hypothetical protein